MQSADGKKVEGYIIPWRALNNMSGYFDCILSTLGCHSNVATNKSVKIIYGPEEKHLDLWVQTGEGVMGFRELLLGLCCGI